MTALERARQKYGGGEESAPMSALERARAKYGQAEAPATGAANPGAAAVAMEQIGEIEHSAPVKGPSQFKARALGAVQGFTSGFAPDILELGGREPLAEALASAVSDKSREAIEHRNKLQEGAATELRKDIDQTRSALPGEFLQGELLGAVAQPGPKLGAAAKGASMAEKVVRAAGNAGLAAGEGALYAAGTGGNAGVGATVSGAANLVAGRLGGAAQRLAARGEARAAGAVTKVAAKAADKEAAPAVQQTVVRVMRPGGEGIQAIGSVEKIEDGIATIYAQGKRIKAPVEQLQPIKAVPFKGQPKAAEAAVEKVTEKGTSAGAKGATLAGSLALAGGGAYAIPVLLEDPDKAVEKLAKGAAGAAAGLALLKGKQGATRLAEIAAAKGAKAMDTAAGRVTRALAGQAAASGRRVGAGTLARIVTGRRAGQNTAQLEQQAVSEGATPEEVQTAVRAGSR
jgi:hypothetical protein